MQTRRDGGAGDVPGGGGQPDAQAHQHTLVHVNDRLARVEGHLERLLATGEQVGAAAYGNTGRLVPAWRRVTRTEQRLPATLAVVSIILLQSRVPERLSLFRWWILPVIEAVILAVLVAANPRRIDSTSKRLRVLSLLLIAVASLANAWAASSLVVGLVHGTEGKDATTLLLSGGNIWATNVVIFALWYWDLDRGGPAARSRAERDLPDFLFPQMTAPYIGPDWVPTFVDYLYLSYTNATAFSPTDTLPTSRWAKLAMMLQSSISLITGALIVARAVNILQ